MFNNVIKKILFLLICIPSFIFCSDYSFSLRNTNTVALVTPQLLPNAHNYAHFSVGVNVNNDHVAQPYDASIYKGLYPEIDALYSAGKKSELESLRSNLNSWKAAALGFVSMSALENRRKVNYIDHLMSGRNLTHLEDLARIAAINSPRSMRRELNTLYDKTTDPVKRCHALIIADRNLGGGFITNRVSSVSFDASDGVFVSHDFYGEIISGNAPVDLMVTTELGSYAVERLLPPSGTQFTPELVAQFSKDLIEIIDKVPESQKKWLIRHACEGFLNRMLDVKGTVKLHRDIACRFAEEVNKSVMYMCINESADYPIQAVKTFSSDIQARIASCSREELAYATGERLADTAYFYIYVKLMSRCASAINISFPCTTSPMVRLINNSCFSNVRGSFINAEISCNSTKAEEIFNGLGVKGIVDKINDGVKVCRVGKLSNGDTAIFRNYCTSMKDAGNSISTIEIQSLDGSIYKFRIAPEQILATYRK